MEKSIQVCWLDKKGYGVFYFILLLLFFQLTIDWFGLLASDLQNAETAQFVVNHVAEQLLAQPTAPPPPLPPTTSNDTLAAAPVSPPVPVTRRPEVPKPTARPPPSTPSPPLNRSGSKVPVASPRAPAAASPRAPQRDESPPPPPPDRQEDDTAPPPPPPPADNVVVAAPSAAAPAPPPPPPSVDITPSTSTSTAAPPPPPPPVAQVDKVEPSSGTSLADQLASVKLKKNEKAAEELRAGNLPCLDPKVADGIAGSLAAALAARRGAVHVEEEGNEDSWSD